MDIRDSPKLVRVQRLDSINLDEQSCTYYTKEGYLIDRPVLTSCGIFQYKNADGTIRRELRLPEYVFDKNSLFSYKGKPIIVTHDAGEVNKNNVSDVEVGTILSEGYSDGNDVRAEIVIHNTDAMKMSGLRELSLGYHLDLIEEPGEYNGEHYDAIQTNIVVNHLALVREARAGEQARLNVDGTEVQDNTLKGGKVMDENTMLSYEELKEAIAMYKAQKAKTTLDEDDEIKANPGEEEKVEPEKETEEVVKEEDKTDEEEVVEEDPQTTIEMQRKQIEALQAMVDKLTAEQEAKEDAEEEKMNADSVDEIFKQRLRICRIGDKLQIDGIEDISINDGKRAIIAKVLPNMRLDGKSEDYIDACYELAIDEMGKAKGVDFQRKQMIANGGARADGNDDGISMALKARQRMLEREENKEEK